MAGPGDYVPDITEGINCIEDLPKAKTKCRSRVYKKRPCSCCGNAACREKIYTRTLHDLGDLAANHPIDIVLRFSQHRCSQCRKYFNVGYRDLADPGCQYTRRVVHMAVRLVVEDLQAVAKGEQPAKANKRIGQVKLHDINFDGYLDFATSERDGAKWGIRHYLVFDKVSGQFVANWLTRRLEQFKHNGIHLDVKSKEIRVDHLVLSEGLVSESYMIQGARLVLVETVEMHYDEEKLPSIITTKRLVNSEMRIIKTEPQ